MLDLLGVNPFVTPRGAIIRNEGGQGIERAVTVVRAVGTGGEQEAQNEDHAREKLVYQ